MRMFFAAMLTAAVVLAGASAAYADNGSILVNIEPPEAVAAGAQWTINAGLTWHDAGTGGSGAPGSRPLTFKPIAGWLTPEPQVLIIVANETTVLTGTYVQSAGAVTVAIEPADAVAAGAQWSIDGGATWLNAGDTAGNVTPGDYTVSFKDVAGWTAPASQAVVVENAQTATATGVYTTVALTQSIEGVIAPEAAIEAGAQWQIDGIEPWYNGGEIVEAAAGSHTVTFKGIDGWLAPDPVSVTVPETPGAPVQATGLYKFVAYVTENGGSDAQDGRSWQTAFASIQLGIDLADSMGGGEVWVALGWYSASVSPVVQLKSNVEVYGGFAGTETARAQRDWAVNVTSITGNQAVLCLGAVDAQNAVLSGFTLTDGASVPVAAEAAPVIVAKADGTTTISNCIFETNATAAYGGALVLAGGSPLISQCQFINNTAQGAGGAVFCANSSPTFSQCRFMSNVSSMAGGAIALDSSTATIVNCLFAYNQAPTGAALANTAAAETISGIVFSTFYQNAAGNVDGFVLLDTAPAITDIGNSILWDTAGQEAGVLGKIEFCDVLGGIEGAGNINADPLFADALSNDFHLALGSPCIDTGTPAADAADIEGTARPQGAGVDMGAFEYAAPSDNALGCFGAQAKTLGSVVEPKAAGDMLLVALGALAMLRRRKVQ